VTGYRPQTGALEGPPAQDLRQTARLPRRETDQDQHGTFHDRGQRGQRLVARVPHKYWKTLTFIAALRHDRIDAPWVIDGPINGDIFTAYVKEVLLPTLAKGDIVILDNLGSHKGKPAQKAIRNAGAHLIFPPAAPT
jgi:hypothetical protein